MITVRLPFPPSVNRYYRSIDRGRVLISEEGRVYAQAVRVVALTQCLPMLRGPFAINVISHPPDYRGRDLDNLWKALLDSLAKAGVIENDKYCQEQHHRWGTVIKPTGLVIVQLKRSPDLKRGETTLPS